MWYALSQSRPGRVEPAGRAARRRRAAFTLVEMLLVITIIAILSTMTFYTVFRALLKARITQMVTEVGQLSGAMQRYATEHGQMYPPDMGAKPNVANVKDRSTRIVEHIRFCYNRAYTNGNYTAYSSMRTFILNNYKVAMSNSASGGSGAGQNLDLDKLDQAEALVFWLGGFPTPVDTSGTPVAGTKLFGFHTDPSSPFRKDTPTGTQPASVWTQLRTKPLFDFDETRLVDIDNDGWWEYIPKGAGPATNGEIAPFVYFDGATYSTLANTKAPISFNGYPIPSGQPGGTPASNNLLSGFGMAVPYASKVPTASGSSTTPINWINGNKFQIICAGIDSNYGDATMRIPVSPGRNAYTGSGFGTVVGYSDGELDNVTNFADTALEDASGT